MAKFYKWLHQNYFTQKYIEKNFVNLENNYQKKYLIGFMFEYMMSNNSWIKLDKEIFLWHKNIDSLFENIKELIENI